MREWRRRAFQRTARVLNGVCGFLFVAFALNYLIVKQGDVLMLSYGMFCHSDTPFDLLSAAVISTMCLVIPAQLLYVFLPLPLSLKALAWSPSYLCLGLLTSLIVHEGFPLWRVSLTLFYVIALVLVIFLAMSRPDFHRHSRPKFISLLASNLTVTLVSIVACWTLSNTSIILHESITTARMLREGRIEEVISSPARMDLLVHRLLRSDDPVGRALNVPHHLGRSLGYAPRDWSVPMSHFVSEAIAEEERRDTINSYPSERLYRLREFQAALSQLSSINNNKK